MSADPHQEIVIVRRRSTLEDAHHGGAWKIAFADFMTAMMAFFLVLWIISATDKNTKTIIARYFNPVKVEEPARAQKGIHGAEDVNAQTPSAEFGVRGAEKSGPGQGDPPGKPPAEGHEGSPGNGGDSRQTTPEPLDPARPRPTMSEDELFRDPNASLDRIAGAPSPGPRLDPVPTPALGFADAAPNSDDTYRDPFRPLGRDQTTHAVSANDQGAQPQAPREEIASEPPQGTGPQTIERNEPESQDSPLRRPQGNESPKTDPARGDAKPLSAAVPAAALSETAPIGNAAAGPIEAGSRGAASLLADLRRRLGPETPSTPGPQLDVQATDEGILISLTDRRNFSMFAIGSAEPQPRVVRMMDAIARSLEAMPGAIILRGHTDAHPYRTARYDNWRLSSARAQMAYYMLNRAGIAEKRFERIEGFADHRLKDKAKPFAAENRRIEILLREAKP